MESRQAANRSLAIKLGLTACLALGFGFALVPLYDVFCRVVGIDAPSRSRERAVLTANAAGEDTTRWVRVDFNSQVMNGLSVVFEPQELRVRAHPGSTIRTNYLVRNTTNKALTINTIHSVSPGVASAHFQKIECFCFQQQTLAPGEERSMPLVFWIDRQLPASVTDITLSYTMYSQPGVKS